jgi:cytochrome bd-type quinol oxidase subunit 2
MSEERTLQYFVAASSTALAAFAAVAPGAAMAKCILAAARRRGVVVTRSAFTVMWSVFTGVRCFPRIVTISIAVQVATAASSTSKGLGPLFASPSMRIFGAPGR